MKTLLPILFLVFALTTSCDPLFIAELRNDTNDTIHLKIELDTTHIRQDIKKYELNVEMKEYLNISADSGFIIQETDLEKFTRDFLIFPKTTIPMDISNKHSPSFSYSKMTILHRNDSIVLAGSENINKAFKKITGFTFRLIIKN